MEWVIWTTYLSGLLGALGYVSFIPLGLFVYGWLQYWCWYGLYQVNEYGLDIILYFETTVRRFLVGSLIYMIAALVIWIPGVNFIVSPLLGWWALEDYFDYEYEFFMSTTEKYVERARREKEEAEKEE